MKTTRSAKLFADAQQVIPGGVNSPVRAFRAVGGQPRFIARAKGARLYDVDGNSYLDYVLSWGPMILGHAAPSVINAIKKAAARGTSYGAPTELEVTLARMIRDAFPSMEKVRLVSSGTEAVMSAIRVARGFTKRDNILKFEGCYHGHSDYLLAKAGSGLATLGIPDSLGVPVDFAKHTLTAPYNDIQAVQQIVKDQRDTLACIILEPIAANMGVVPPAPEFLHALRRLTEEQGILLIFDEVISGFRVTYGGAQALYGIKPDLTVLGKIIGGGLPVGAYGGRKEIMDLIAPLGPVYQAGTLSGNPLAVSAGIETLKQLKARGVYKKLEEQSSVLAKGIGWNNVKLSGVTLGSSDWPTSATIGQAVIEPKRTALTVAARAGTVTLNGPTLGNKAYKLRLIVDQFGRGVLCEPTLAVDKLSDYHDQRCAP